MEWTDLHARILSGAFAHVLGKSNPGALAFVRCLTPDVVLALAQDSGFAPPNWSVWRVGDAEDSHARTITADRAVEMRETKGEPTLLLVDTSRAGAGMDGIYSAARELDEGLLFSNALHLAAAEVTRQLSGKARKYAERAVKNARSHGRRFSVSLWTEFDFLCRVASERKQPGAYLHLLGLWPVQEAEDSENSHSLELSRVFVDRLLATPVAGITPVRRIESLRLLNATTRQLEDLERFLTSAATKPLLSALSELSTKEHLWINTLQIEGAAQVIHSIELISWRTKTDRIAAWSGLIEEAGVDEPPVLILKPDADRTGDYSKLEVRWKVRPDNLESGAADYRVVLLTDMEEELASRDVSHSGKKEEKCRFTNDDFSMLSEDALISAKVIVSVIGNDSIEPQESVEFVIRFGHPPEREQGGVGKKVRTFGEGLIELDDREFISTIASSSSILPVDSKGYAILRTPTRGKSFRVYRPPLIEEIENQWSERTGAIGRWRVKVRASGTRASEAEFIPFETPGSSAGTLWETVWGRAVTASRRMADRFSVCGGGVGQIYDEKSKVFDTVVKEYVLAWTALIEGNDPLYALANTVEVQSLSGRTIGLIVLPNHALRVAWRVAYDNLVLHAKFEQNMTAKDVRDEFSALDGAMFPAFLPGLQSGASFVFADTLGFHAVGMVSEHDKEPKAALALLARAFGESETADTIPTVGKQSATILGNEIVKYVECHNTSKLLHIHALRPGDGFTIARSLGHVYDKYRRSPDDDDSDPDSRTPSPAFVLELYPSQEQRGLAGRFIAEAGEKRRSGAGVLSPDDHWMLESLSLPGEVNLPRLRWARKNEQDPATPAHLAVAFDTFASSVVSQEKNQNAKTKPLYAFGLLSFFERTYSTAPAPLWQSEISFGSEGEKHPSDRTHTDRLARLQLAIQRSVSRSLGAADDQAPVLRTEISPAKAQSLRELHRLCDWVITLDRNAGIEYFDSPKDNKDIYDAYVIDCVPERQDLGCLQLITSTSNLEEVRNLLDASLDQMGLSRSRRNAEFLMEHLKALSGRLAIRLTGQRAPTSELVALALSHANCRQTSATNVCWVPLSDGFIIPVDDVRDLLPLLLKDQEGVEDEKESRPDLIYVTATRKGLLFRFIEVKYRRHLRTARTPELLQSVLQQVQSLQNRWDTWYGTEPCSSFRGIRRAKLARVLRFYADKAHRHYLGTQQYEVITGEIDRMIERGSDYSFAEIEGGNLGWIFCPEFGAVTPLEISPAGWDTRIFLFGPGLLPDSDFRQESILHPDAKPDSTLISKSMAQMDSEKGKNGDAPELISPSTSEAAEMQKATNNKAETRLQDLPSACLGTDVLTGAEVRWRLTVKGNPHLLIAGLPGMGKTTCLLNICKQMDAVSIRPIVFSYHEDIDTKLKDLVNDVRFIDFHGLGFNPLDVIDRESRVAYLDVAGAMRDIFVAIYPELGDIQGERIRTAIKESFVEAGWDNPTIALSEMQEPNFNRFVEILRNDPKPDRGLRTLLARLGELEDYGFFNLSEVRESLWTSDQPTVIRIHTTQNDNLQRAFASLVFYGLYKDMFRRGIQNKITHAVIFDEAHRAASLRLIPTMAKECRKYGISLVLASQEAKDFNISLFSAIANYLVLRLTESDAKALVRNVASSQQERTLIDKIKQMERFKALYFCEGRTKPSFVSLMPI